jgi:hypothetical protein
MSHRAQHFPRNLLPERFRVTLQPLPDALRVLAGRGSLRRTIGSATNAASDRSPIALFRLARRPPSEFLASGRRN